MMYPGHLSRIIGMVGLCAMIGGAYALNERNDAQRREIERRSTTCPPALAGEQRAATVQKECGSEAEELRCIYISTSAYGRSARSRPAMPGRAS